MSRKLGLLEVELSLQKLEVSLVAEDALQKVGLL